MQAKTVGGEGGKKGGRGGQKGGRGRENQATWGREAEKKRCKTVLLHSTYIHASCIRLLREVGNTYCTVRCLYLVVLKNKNKVFIIIFI